MINQLVTKHLAAAFSGALRDAVQPFTGTRKGSAGEYDPVLGEYVGGASLSYTGRGVFGGYNDLEIQATQVKITDTKLTCLQAEITTIPQVDDVITNNDNDLRVMSIKQDPTSSIWIMQLRGLNDVV